VSKRTRHPGGPVPRLASVAITASAAESLLGAQFPLLATDRPTRNRDLHLSNQPRHSAVTVMKGTVVVPSGLTGGALVPRKPRLFSGRRLYPWCSPGSVSCLWDVWPCWPQSQSGDRKTPPRTISISFPGKASRSSVGTRGSRKTQVVGVPTSRKPKLWAIPPFRKGMEPSHPEARASRRRPFPSGLEFRSSVANRTT
jgi:hypothetical protein